MTLSHEIVQVLRDVLLWGIGVYVGWKIGSVLGEVIIYFIEDFWENRKSRKLKTSAPQPKPEPGQRFWSIDIEGTTLELYATSPDKNSRVALEHKVKAALEKLQREQGDSRPSTPVGTPITISLRKHVSEDKRGFFIKGTVTFENSGKGFNLSYGMGKYFYGLVSDLARDETGLEVKEEPDAGEHRREYQEVSQAGRADA